MNKVNKKEKEIKEIEIISSEYQTKIWREKQEWYKNGKHNECETYQINIINSITNIKCEKTKERIYKIDNKIYIKKNPYCEIDGFEWTEDFDGKIILNNKIYYFNLKFVCDFGGAQIRKLKEVYDFIKTQIDFINNNKINNIYFINILDGETSFKNIDKFHFLINKNEIYKNIYLYVI